MFFSVNLCRDLFFLPNWPAKEETEGSSLWRQESMAGNRLLEWFIVRMEELYSDPLINKSKEVITCSTRPSVLAEFSPEWSV
jgi:hypothetical protein